MTQTKICFIQLSIQEEKFLQYTFFRHIISDAVDFLFCVRRTQENG